MRRFFLISSFLLFSLIIFLIPKASALAICKVSSVLPVSATSNDNIRVTVTSLQPGLYYALQVANANLTPSVNYLGTPVDIQRSDGSSIEFSVGKLPPEKYIFAVSGRDAVDFRSMYSDLCFNEDTSGFEVLPAAGTTPAVNQTLWIYDPDLKKCVQKPGGLDATEAECKQRMNMDDKPDPYCQQLQDVSGLPNCSVNSEISDIKGCITLDLKKGYVCGNPQEQILCVNQGVDPTKATIGDVKCATPPSLLAPCLQWGAWNGTQYVSLEEKNLGDYIDLKKGYIKPGNKVTCLILNTAISNFDVRPQELVKTVFNLVLGISGGIALILIMLSGYKFMTSGGNPEKTKAATEQLTAAIIGLLFIIFSFVILQIVGVDILKIPGFQP